MNQDKAPTPTDYSELSPDTLLNAIDSCDLQTDGRLLALNSYENRVYQAGIESAGPVIAKFYRPGRWTDAAIIEEHDFSLELVNQELPVIAPIKIGDTASRFIRDREGTGRNWVPGRNGNG
jgi:Ser/Thr protein kinase RdoA (MazF antagonist)